MLDLLDMIDFVEEVLRESTDPVKMRDMLRKEHQRLTAEFKRLETSMEEAS